MGMTTQMDVTPHKATRADLMALVSKIIEDNTAEPADSLRAEGQALIAIADALKGRTPSECRAVLRAVQAIL